MKHHVLQKHILAAIACIFSVVVSAASDAYTVKTVPNVRIQNAQDYVSDPASLLAQSTHDSINVIFARLEASTGIEASVVMLPSIGEADPFNFSVELFRYWGIGKKKNNNGLLILYVEDQHNVRFTTGYGIEGTLTDAISKRIQTKCMVPCFKDGKRDEGMKEGCKAVAAVLDGSMKAGDLEEDADDGFSAVAVLLVFVVFFGIMALQASRNNRKCPQCGKSMLKLQSVHEGIANGRRYKVSIYKCSHCGHMEKRKEYSDNDDDGTGAILSGMTMGSILGSGRSYGGGFSGGSFGGGSTGGGGAGSSW